MVIISCWILNSLNYNELVQGGDNLNKAIKIRLFPTKEQEILMFKSIGCSRFVYNWALNRCNERYEQGEKYSIKEIRKD